MVVLGADGAGWVMVASPVPCCRALALAVWALAFPVALVARAVAFAAACCAVTHKRVAPRFLGGLRRASVAGHPWVMSNVARELDWNGRDLPPELAVLPPGRYMIELLEPLEDWNLSPEQVAGLEAAAQAHDRGEGIPWAQVDARLRERLASRKPPA
jgi:hypothetical protein